MQYSAMTKGFHFDDDPNLPPDSVEVSEEIRLELLNAQSAGKVIIPDQAGNPVAVDPPPPTADEEIKRQILALESQQTPRRIREALLGVDGGWLAGIESQIEALRAQLEAL